jgi:hypothetical protein
VTSIDNTLPRQLTYLACLLSQDEDVTISAVLKFRKALFFIQKEFPFSYSFGAASSREECVASAQKVYERLVLHKIERDYLHFETLALLALDSKGRVDADKARQLIKVCIVDCAASV